LEENDVLVKTAYVSQNPTGEYRGASANENRTLNLSGSTLVSTIDWKHTVVPGIAVPNATIGCDFSGVVVKLGSGIKNSSIKVGDKVAGMVHGGKFEDKGSFAQYLRVQSDLVWAVPETGNVGLREAPVYGVGFVTAAQVSKKGCHGLSMQILNVWSWTDSLQPPRSRSSTSEDLW
jgi:hypothetical protein